jgi:hypothetical protein
VRRKHTKRLSDAELARRLEESGLIERGVLDALLERVGDEGLLCEGIVESGLVGDWELSRWACRWFGRPFLPLELCTPTAAAAEGLDGAKLIRRGLVPLWRSAGGLVVAMPGITSEEALQALSQDAGCPVYAVVGSVRGNRRWLEENLAPAPLPDGDPREGDSWSLLFDVGDAQARDAFGRGREA